MTCSCHFLSPSLIDISTAVNMERKEGRGENSGGRWWDWKVAESVLEASRLSGWSSQSLWCGDQYYIVRRMSEAITVFFSSLHLSFHCSLKLSLRVKYSQGELGKSGKEALAIKSPGTRRVKYSLKLALQVLNILLGQPLLQVENKHWLKNLIACFALIIAKAVGKNTFSGSNFAKWGSVALSFYSRSSALQ